MEVFGFAFSIWWIFGAIFFVLIAGFYIVDRLTERVAAERRKRRRPDVDQQRAELMRNHGPGGRAR